MAEGDTSDKADGSQDPDRSQLQLGLELTQATSETSSLALGSSPLSNTPADIGATPDDQTRLQDNLAGDKTLQGRVRRGAAWTAGSVIIMRLANIGLMAVVARIVTPDEFGVFAIALAVHAMVTSIAELGVASAVARADLDLDKIASTVTTIAIASATFLAVVLAVGAPALAELLGSAQAADPLRVLAISVALIGPFAVPGAQLQRDFRQDRVFLANAISFVPASVVLVLLAAVGDGAMAFAWSRVVGQVIAGTVMVFSVHKLYGPGFRTAELPGLIRFGIPLAAANLLSQVLLNIDYLFVGRVLGVVSLGLYSIAFNVASWPTAVMGSVLNGVVLPAFSRVQRGTGVLAPAVAYATRTVMAVALPIGAMTMSLSQPLIATLYGAQWESASPVLVILAAYGIISIACLLFSNVIIAMGRTGLLLAVQVASSLALVPALWWGIDRLGLPGAGVAHIVVISLVTLPVYLVALHRSTGAGPASLAVASRQPMIAALISGLLAWAASHIPAAAPLQLLVGGTLGCLCYLLLAAPSLTDLAPGRVRDLAPVRRVLAWHAVLSRIGARLRRSRTAKVER